MPIRGLRELVFLSRQTVFENNFSATEWLKYLPGGHTRIENVLFAPLPLKDRVVGLLGLANKPGGFDEQDSRMAGAFGKLAAVALQNSRDLESLEKGRERFRSVAQTAGEAIICSDSQGKVVLWNQAAEKIFGYKSGEIIGKSITTIMPQRFRTDHHRAIIRFFSNAGPDVEWKTREMAGRRKGGAEFPLELSLSSWRVHEDVFFTALVRDIAVRKRTEEELVKAKEAAESANRAKSRFLADLSHEIRTPLNVVIGMTKLVLDTSLNAEQREFLGAVQSSSQHLSTLIKDVLDISKIEAGRIELEWTEFSLKELLAQTVKELGLIAKDKGLKLLTKVHPQAPDRVVGDSARLHQVISNLVGNAIKFTERGRVLLEVGAGVLEGDMVELNFKVSDTGIGIEPQKQRDIFQPFVQGASSTSRQYGGTGLGLAISIQLVRLMGGDMQVQSQLGHGSTFSFQAALRPAYPAAAHSAAAQPIAASPSPKSKLPAKPARILSILLAEDNQDIQKLLQILLNLRGHRVSIVGDGEEVLPALENDSFDLVLMDLYMPMMSGFETAAKVRSMDGKGWCIPIVAMSAYDASEKWDLCQAAGMDGYLLKPIEPDELYRTIEEIAG